MAPWVHFVIREGFISMLSCFQTVVTQHGLVDWVRIVSEQYSASMLVVFRANMATTNSEALIYVDKFALGVVFPDDPNR